MSDVKSVTVKTILFDMDGTLVSSHAGVVGAWESFALKYPTLNITEILKVAHGVRTQDNLRKWCPDLTEDELASESARFEVEIVNAARRNVEKGGKGIELLPGVKDALAPFANRPTTGNPGWAICTSATRLYATSALKLSGITEPRIFVAAEDVTRGKPFPDPYLLGAEKCGVSPTDCIVVEDTPAGIRSGQAAGCKTLALCTTFPREVMEVTEADFIVEDLSQVTVTWAGDQIEILIRNSERPAPGA